MLRIVFSRAALFPWLGLGLLAAGAACAEGSTLGMILVVVGANVAFFSLHNFSQKFTWGDATRPMLTLCAILFLMGLALAACALRFESMNRWLALLCAGLYLSLFAVWTTQQLVSWHYRVLGIVGVLAMILGGIVALLGWQDWRVFAESEEVPQEITLAELQRNGHGSNRYIRLREFRFCDGSAAEKGKKESKLHERWTPLVAVDGQQAPGNGPSPPVPARIEVVSVSMSVGSSEVAGLRAGVRRVPDPLQKKREHEGYECTVVTGIKSIKPEVRQQLGELAPQTDFDEVIVLDWRTPGSSSRVYGGLAGGGTGLFLGWLAIGVMYARAWKEAGKDRRETADQDAIEQGDEFGRRG